MPSTQPICADCQHLRINPKFSRHGPVCAAVEFPLDPVTGEPQRNCARERCMPDGPCGLDGKLFKPRDAATYVTWESRPAAAQQQPSKPPAIGQHWPEQGGIYVGIVSDLPGGVPGHLVLLPAKPAKKLSWGDAIAWAEALGNGARLPTRVESLLIYANAVGHVKKAWHWTCEQDDASYAWYCYVNYGYQLYGHKLNEFSAVAVRRLEVQSFSSLNGGAA